MSYAARTAESALKPDGQPADAVCMTANAHTTDAPPTEPLYQRLTRHSARQLGKRLAANGVLSACFANGDGTYNVTLFLPEQPEATDAR